MSALRSTGVQRWSDGPVVQRWSDRPVNEDASGPQLPASEFELVSGRVARLERDATEAWGWASAARDRCIVAGLRAGELAERYGRHRARAAAAAPRQ